MIADGLPPLREVVARHHLQPRKSLGQNFIFDLNLTSRIARAAGTLETGTTIEVGPGPGGLTRSLLAHGAREVIVIERDSRCLNALGEIAALYPKRLQIIAGDALLLDIDELGVSPRRVVANLPYNIGTALLLRWLADASAFESFTLLLQKEVVDRLVAKPRTKDYGRISVVAQWLTECKRLFDVPPRAFVPPPKVISSLVRLKIRPQPLFPAEMRWLERVTKAAFGQRRKMLRQSLRSEIPDPEPLLAECNIRPEARAEELTVEQFCALARALASRRD